jgi:hypothetical protein
LQLDILIETPRPKATEFECEQQKSKDGHQLSNSDAILLISKLPRAKNEDLINEYL